MTWLGRLTLLALLSGASGCTHGTVSDFCLIAKPIRPAAADVLTDGTVTQILAHDETGKRLCGW